MKKLSTIQLTTSNNNILVLLNNWQTELLQNAESQNLNQDLANNFFNLACTDTEIGNDTLDELHDLNIVDMNYVYDILSNHLEFDEATPHEAKQYQQVGQLERKVNKQQRQGLRKSHTEWLTTSDYNGDYFPIDKKTLTDVLNDMTFDCKNMIKCN